MNISTYVCGACTTASIAQLGLEKNAKSAMITFLKSQLVGQRSRYDPAEKGYNLLESFYVYTAGPEEPGHGHSQSWVK